MHHYLRNLSLLIMVCTSLVGAFSFGSYRSTNLLSRSELASKPLTFPDALPNDRPVPLLDLVALTRNADMIVLGQVASIREQGRIAVTLEDKITEGQLMTAELTAQRTLKGTVDGPTVSFEFAVPIMDSGYKKIASGQFGLFFLRNNENGHHTVLSPYYPFVVASQDSSKLEGSELDRVVSTIARLLVQRNTELRREAVYVLDTASTDAATEALRQAVRDNDTVVRFQAVAALLRRGDISVLDIAEDILMHPNPGVEQYLKRNVSVGLEGIKDPRAIRTLTHLLGASDVQTRRSSAGALRRTHTAAAIGPLLTALKDSDHDVRYQGVIGLAELTGQYEWGPSVELFLKDEQHYVAHWQEWGRTQK
jgi:hypothetical protein